jgi:hypothetical protein
VTLTALGAARLTALLGAAPVAAFLIGGAVATSSTAGDHRFPRAQESRPAGRTGDPTNRARLTPVSSPAGRAG